MFNTMNYIILSIDTKNDKVMFNCLTNSKQKARRVYMQVFTKYKNRSVKIICSVNNYEYVYGLDVLNDINNDPIEHEISKQVIYKIFAKL